jgi:signal peptidase I
MIRTQRVLRIARLVLLLGVAITLAAFWRSCHRVRIPDADQSMYPTYPGGSVLIVEDLEPDAPLERGTDVMYAVEIDGKGYERFGRVRGLPGDIVGVKDGRLTVNGDPVGAIPGEPMGEVPEGTVLILAINPLEIRYPDSRKLSFIPRERVVAVIRTKLG